jgi:hypothetical protein
VSVSLCLQSVAWVAQASPRCAVFGSLCGSLCCSGRQVVEGFVFVTLFVRLYSSSNALSIGCCAVPCCALLCRHSKSCTEGVAEGVQTPSLYIVCSA